MESLSSYLIDEHEADRANIRFKGDEIKLLGDTLTWGIDKAGDKDGYVSTGMSTNIEMGIFWEQVFS